MSTAKVTLSTKELELVTNTEWILTKNQVIQKAYALFGLIGDSYQHEIKQFNLYQSNEVLARSPKIARGENYQGLPWVMLDFPRYYVNADMLGIRSFFWWGNVFSISLLLGGKFQQHYAPALERNLKDPILAKDWLLCVGDTPWVHHFGEDNYQPVLLTKDQIGTERHFVKLTKKLGISDWADKQIEFEKGFNEINRLLH
jgi:hypothetical protein